MSARGRQLAAVVAGLSGASLGAGGVVVWERTLLEAGPPGWTTTLPELPVVLAALSGPPALPGDGWPLASHAVLTPPDSKASRLSVAARLQRGGHLDVRLHAADGGPSTALLIDRGQVPYAMMVEVTEGGGGRGQSTRSEPRPLSCDTPLEPPDTEDVAVELHTDAGAVVAVVSGGGHTQTTRCRTHRRMGGGVSVRSGVRRVGLRSVGTGDETLEAPTSSLGMRALFALVISAVMALSALFSVSRLRLSSRRVALVALPLVAVFPLAFTDLVSATQAVRLVLQQPLWAAVAVPVIAAVGLAVVGSQVRLARSTARLRPYVAAGLGAVLGAIALPGYGAVGILAVPCAAAAGVGLQKAAAALGNRGLGPLPGMVLGALTALVVVTALDPLHGMALTFAGLVAACGAGLVWVNVARPRGWNPASLLLFCVAVFFADQGLRWTELGGRLTGRSSRAGDPGADQLGGTFSSFEALEHRREWQKYPLQDYPVAPAARRSGATRIVAMGGSSTGGAWQNDNLGQFWPAELERSVGSGAQVVNLGVGGWTTFHIRRFLETRLEVADPDVVVLYIGHNDILTASPRPYNELFEAWRAGGSTDLALSGALARVPLYQLARFSLQAAAGRHTGAAVPLSDARQNLLTIVELLESRGARLLLTREGIAPDPSALDPYGQMLAEVADAHPSVAYVDIAGQLSGPGAAGVFIDDCHLTQPGHAKVARLVREGLSEAGWLQGPPRD